MKLSLSLTFIAAGLAAARSDWSKPCFHGECNYELEHPSGGFATLHFVSPLLSGIDWMLRCTAYVSPALLI